MDNNEAFIHPMSGKTPSGKTPMGKLLQKRVPGETQPLTKGEEERERNRIRTGVKGFKTQLQKQQNEAVEPISLEEFKKRVEECSGTGGSPYQEYKPKKPTGLYTPAPKGMRDAVKKSLEKK
jgi:hypothetical protein